MKNLKILVCGSRSFQDESFVKKHLSCFIQFIKTKLDNFYITIISGGAKGPDTFGENFAKENNLKLGLYPAEWDIHGRSAGFIRNEQMIYIADICIAYHFENSKGTQHTINLAKEKGILTIIAGTSKVKKVYNEEALEALIEQCRNHQEL